MTGRPAWRRAYLSLAGGPRPATVFTIHNLAFQGQVPSGLLAELRLPAHAYTPDGVEYYGAIGMLKAGIRFADRITTVSPTLCRGDLHAGRRHGDGRPVARPRRRNSAAYSTA